MKSGQASVEYILLIAAMTSIIFYVSGIIKDKLLPQGAVCTATDKSFSCAFQRFTESLGAQDANFRYFYLRR